MFWDGHNKPSVSVPFGDFFCSILGNNSAFENALFSNPGGRSYNVFIPMPFKSGARIDLINEADYQVSLVFYDINFTLEDIPEDALYFLAWWLYENPTLLGKDFTILPKITGRGKYLGVHIGLIVTERYRKNWWGEGEIKIYIDGDKACPSLVGTGTEDYIGTGWGQGTFFIAIRGAQSPKGHILASTGITYPTLSVSTMTSKFSFKL